MSQEDLSVELVRSGGFAGLVQRYKVDVGDLPPDEARRLADLLDRADLRSMAGRPPGPGKPDRFQYDLEVRRSGDRYHVTVGEADLTPELKTLVDRLSELGKRR